MRSNDALFANDKKKGKELQTGYIKNISAFKATVYDTNLNNKISTLGIDYNFKNSDNVLVNFKGVHKQKWKNGLIVAEDFYTDDYLDFPEFKKNSLSHQT